MLYVLMQCMGLLAGLAAGFQQSSTLINFGTRRRGLGVDAIMPLFMTGQQDLVSVRSYLQENYPDFHKLIDNNDELWMKLSYGNGYTMFVPNGAAFQALGSKKLDQLNDARNSETTCKIGACHCISEVVTFDNLFNAGGVVTLGGAIDVDRSTSGGMFGVGAKEDGGVLVNGAKIISTFEVGPGLIHEVDKLVSPSILWRYMDQLRIPGSK